MSRETEVADYLRSDATLRDLAPGGIYPDAMLPESGLTNAKLMTKVWAGGTFQTTIVVRERAPVPTGDLVDLKERHESVSQVVEIYVYQRGGSDGVLAALKRVRDLLLGHRFSGAWPVERIGGRPIAPAPELAGANMGRVDFRILFIERPLEV